jgi:ubiquinone/menaquinone biosynthesis C-methylase UbiE
MDNTSERQVVPTQDGYDLWSAIYDAEDNPLIVLEEPQVNRLLGDVRGLRIANLGCGTGRHTLTMARAGARVTAVDFSMGMMVKARGKPGAETVQFIRHDLSCGLPFASRTFDRVTCCLVLEHIADLDRIIGEMARICRPEGRILLSDLHPAMRLWNVQAQFTDPASGRKLRPASAMHQLSDYVMAASRARLRIDHMGEHIVDAALATRVPRVGKHLGWPLLLVLQLRHGG